MLSSNEVYYTDESAQGKNFFEKFSDPVIGDVLKRLVNQTTRALTAGPCYMKAPSSGCA